MKTIIHVYDYDTKEPDEAAAYMALEAKLRNGPHRMKSLPGQNGKGHYEFVRALDGQVIELETQHLFENQWNTAPIPGVSDQGLRVFDWAEDSLFTMHGRERLDIRRGHWLEQTAEMREIRRNTLKCRYCSRMEAAQKGYVFCPHCIGNEYLTEKDLHLTRMKAIDDRSDCAPLTEAERAHLLPLFKEAQLHGNTERDKKRIAAARARIASDYTKETRAATDKRDAFTWLMDHGIKLDNVIYYDHTETFCFGWRTPLGPELLSALLEVISEFHWPYEIKCADGRKLNGNIG